MTTNGKAVDLSNGDGTCQRIHEMDDSELVGVPVTVAGDSVVGYEMASVAVEVKTDVKRKRGRPPRGQGKLPPAKKQKEKEDEDVCFICFDGGSLVVCDRRSCPKAYHPACIKRDEAFFQSKAKWTCGWHICSVCEKAAHYMCYTCTYSLCKGCTKDANYVCVRGDKGFCATCMKTIMLIEDEELRNKEMVGLDFDDASSWEYLFKIYWVYLKGNLSLTNKELAEAKNPWKESGAMAYKGQSSNIRGDANNFKSSVMDMSTGQLKGNDYINPDSNESLKRLNEDTISTQKQCNEKGTSSVVTTKWATEELLDFVAYMKNGDVSVLSQSDVQALVLDYVRVNNLCDPHQESHFVCDSRLETLFGKRRVGHFELLKLLDFHFFMKVESANNVVDVNAIQVLSEPSNNNLIGKDKKPKTHKKGKVCGLQANPNEYAMIDVPTISLIYVRRNLMEKLIKVKDKFHEMVVGSVVRIRIAGGEQKQDMYRLVQVVGIIKVSDPYKINDTAADVMLEVLNLDKREVVSIAAISNQDVSEDDCRRLRQSIKCRLVKCFTVGEILEKAKLLQAVRLNDSLEAEMSRLNHLRNQAIEKGCKKELIECVEKLHILKTPEERQRRLSQILEVRSDPTMDPNYESEEDAGENDDGKKSHQVKPSNSKYNREVKEPVSLKKGDISDDNDSRPSSPSCERSRNLCAASYPDKEESAAKALQRLSEGKDAWRPNSLERVGGNSQTVASSTTMSVISSEMSTASLPMGNIPFAYNGETMLWHYRDPNGKIQGPFCMFQLQQWSTTGYFPLDMRIWVNDKQDDSILLSDALNGNIQKAFPWLNNISSQVREVGGTSDSKSFNANVGWNENINATKDGRQTQGNWCGNTATVNFNSDADIASGRLDTQSSVWTAPIVSCNKDMTAVSCSQDHESFKGNGSCQKPLQAHSPLSSSTLTVRDYVNHRHEINYEVKNGNPNSGHENMGSHGTTICNSTARHMLGNHYNSQGFPSQSSVNNSSHAPANFSSKNLDLNSTFSPTKSTDSPDQSGEVNITSFNSPSQKAGYVDCEYEVTENKESVSSSVHFHDPGTLNLASPSPKINCDYQKSLSVEKKQSVSSKVTFQDSGPSWSSTSNVTVGRAQLADITDVWGGYTSAPVKHSLEWDSNLISVSSLLHDHVGTANSRNGELTHFNLSHPASNISGWHTAASGPIEFDTLAEESVSDLLAEVDAMESQCGLPSPTSMRNSGEDLINLNLEMA